MLLKVAVIRLIQWYQVRLSPRLDAQCLFDPT